MRREIYYTKLLESYKFISKKKTQDVTTVQPSLVICFTRYDLFTSASNSMQR